ncbi:MAG: hypothetical protein AB1921_07595 [Thermodesulfobacteriota bacterium]
MTGPKRRDKISALAAAAFCSAAAALFTAAALWKTEADPDLFGYLAFGRLYFSGGAFPYHDVFSYLPVRPVWVYHEWLTGVVLFRVLTGFGPEGLQVLRWALGLSALWLCARAAQRLGAGLVPVCLTLFLCVNIWAAGYNPVRAQVFTYLFFAASLYLAVRARESAWASWLFVPLTLLWQNLHGGFPAGIALFLLCAVFARGVRLRFLLPALASLCLVWVNPYGFSYYPYMAEALTFPRAEIGEWLPLWKALAVGYPLSAAACYLLLAALAVLLFRKASWQPEEAAVLAGTFLAGLLVIRHQVFFALCGLAFLPPALDRPVRSYGKPVLAVLVAALLANGYAFAVQARLALDRKNPLALTTPACPEQACTSVAFPVEAVTYLRQRGFTGKIVTDFAWGEYVLWKLWPECRVALDGRYDTVFPKEICREYLDFVLGKPDGREFLVRYPPDAVLTRIGSDVDSRMRFLPGWVLAHSDCASALFLREAGKRKPSKK